jgi:2-polyprenyl-3-methyl-5-hydroxy-6-metoxy-1,4-benzoquinol methylase
MTTAPTREEYRYWGAERGCAHAYLWPALVDVLARRAPAPSRVFELGCGNGSTARMLAERGHEVVAIDPSESGIAIARDQQRSGVRFEVGSTADDLEVFGAFPVVVSLEVIEHCVSPREFMRAFCSVLAPDGVGIISTPYHGYLKTLLIVLTGHFDAHFDPLWEAGHIRFFSVDKLRALFAEFGLEIVEMHRVGRIPVLAKSLVAVVRRARR